MSNGSTGETVDGSNPYQRNIELPPFPDINEGYLPRNVFVHFHLTPHRTAEQFNEARTLLDQADIFAAENVGWNAKQLRDVNAVSKGDKRILLKLKSGHQDNINGGFADAMLEGFYGSYKPVVFIDADETQKHMIIGDNRIRFKRAIGHDIEATLSGFADVLAIISEASYSRDVLMTEMLGPKISKLVGNHPRLVNKEQVNVLFVLGFAHNLVYEALTEAVATRDQVSVSWWSHMPKIDIESAIVQKYKEGSAPNREEIVEFAIAYALDITILPSISSSRLFNFNSGYKHTPDVHDLMGGFLVEAIRDLGQDGLDLVHRIMNKNATRADIEYLQSLAKNAKAQARQ